MGSSTVQPSNQPHRRRRRRRHHCHPVGRRSPLQKARRTIIIPIAALCNGTARSHPLQHRHHRRRRRRRRQCRRRQLATRLRCRRRLTCRQRVGRLTLRPLDGHRRPPQQLGRLDMPRLTPRYHLATDGHLQPRWRGHHRHHNNHLRVRRRSPRRKRMRWRRWDCRAPSSRERSNERSASSRGRPRRRRTRSECGRRGRSTARMGGSRRRSFGRRIEFFFSRSAKPPQSPMTRGEDRPLTAT